MSSLGFSWDLLVRKIFLLCLCYLISSIGCSLNRTLQRAHFFFSIFVISSFWRAEKLVGCRNIRAPLMPCPAPRHCWELCRAPHPASSWCSPSHPQVLPTPSCSSISPGFSSKALCAQPHLVQGKGCLKHLLLHQVMQLLWEQSRRDRVRLRDLGRWSRGTAGSCSPNLPASGCRSKSTCLSSPLFYSPQDGKAAGVPVPRILGQDSSCSSRLSITNVIPIPLPKSDVTVFCRMKCTTRILNNEKLCLKAALGYSLMLYGSGKQGREGRSCALKYRQAREREMWAVRRHQLCTWEVKEGSVENEKPGTAVN